MMEFAAAELTAGRENRYSAAQPVRSGRAFALAGLAHGTALALLCLLTPQAIRPAAPPAGIEMVFVAPQSAPMQAFVVAPATLRPPAPAVVALRNPDPILLRPPDRLATRLPPRVVLPVTKPPLAEAAPATVRQAAPVVPTSPALADAPPGRPAMLTALYARVSEAVQEAAIYPPAARLQHREGSAQVRFDYDDGAVAALVIARSSAFRSLDAAALNAVRRANMPHAPAELSARKLPMLVWVRFGLVSED